MIQKQVPPPKFGDAWAKPMPRDGVGDPHFTCFPCDSADGLWLEPNGLHNSVPSVYLRGL